MHYSERKDLIAYLLKVVCDKQHLKTKKRTSLDTLLMTAYFCEIHPILGHLYADTRDLTLVLSIYTTWKDVDIYIPEQGTALQVKDDLTSVLYQIESVNKEYKTSRKLEKLCVNIDTNTGDLSLNRSLASFVERISVGYPEVLEKVTAMLLEASKKRKVVDLKELFACLSAEIERASQLLLSLAAISKEF